MLRDCAFVALYPSDAFIHVQLRAGLILSVDVASVALESPSPAVLRWLLGHGCPIDASVGLTALKSAEKELPGISVAVAGALLIEQLGVLLPHLPSDEGYAAAAAALPHAQAMTTLELIRAHPFQCPLTDSAIVAAASVSNLRAWRWLVDDAMCTWVSGSLRGIILEHILNHVLFLLQISEAVCVMFEAAARAHRRRPTAVDESEAECKAALAADADFATHRAWISQARGGLGCPCGGRLHVQPSPHATDSCLVCCEPLLRSVASSIPEHGVNECHTPIVAPSLLLRCAHCEVFVHACCADGWFASLLEAGKALTCMHCRAPWRSDEWVSPTVTDRGALHSNVY
jgi:hypothetical protein